MSDNHHSNTKLAIMGRCTPAQAYRAGSHRGAD